MTDLNDYPLKDGEYDVDDNDAICPQCGNRWQVELCDWPGARDGSTCEEECDVCHTKFILTFCVSYHFRSERAKEKED